MLPAQAAEDVVTKYIVRTSSVLAGAGSSSEEEKEEEEKVVLEHSALLPTEICQCNLWNIPKPKGAKDDADVVEVTVTLIAESEAGCAAAAARRG